MERSRASPRGGVHSRRRRRRRRQAAADDTLLERADDGGIVIAPMILTIWVIEALASQRWTYDEAIKEHVMRRWSDYMLRGT